MAADVMPIIRYWSVLLLVWLLGAGHNLHAKVSKQRQVVQDLRPRLNALPSRGAEVVGKTTRTAVDEARQQEHSSFYQNVCAGPRYWQLGGHFWGGPPHEESDNPPEATRTSVAELFYLRHLRSCAANASGSQGGAASGSSAQLVAGGPLLGRLPSSLQAGLGVCHAALSACGPGALRGLAYATHPAFWLPVVGAGCGAALTGNLDGLGQRFCEVLAVLCGAPVQALSARALLYATGWQRAWAGAALLAWASGFHASTVAECRLWSAVAVVGTATEVSPGTLLAVCAAASSPVFPPGPQAGAAGQGQAALDQLVVIREDGRWQCPWCSRTYGSKGSLVQHVGRTHEGENSQGSAMAAFLTFTNRWLCASCLTTSAHATDCCRSCGGFEQAPGEAPSTFSLYPPPAASGPAAAEAMQVDSAGAAAAGSASPAASHAAAAQTRAPPVEEVFKRRNPLVRHLPRKVRDLWATVLTTELQGAVHGSEEEWVRLHLLAQCCLWLPAGRFRGGVRARGSSTLSAIISRRLRRWQAGDWQSVWAEAKQEQDKRSRDSKGGDRGGLASSARRAKRKASEGQWAKGCQCLGSPGVYPMTADVVAELGNLHPTGPPVPALVQDLPEAILANDEEVLEALKSFPADAAAGITGLSPQHLLDAAKCPSPVLQGRLILALTAVVNVLATGDGPAELSAFLAGAPLTPLRKDATAEVLKVRPIAVGETLCRLVGKVLVKHASTKQRLDDLFVPCQLGVGCQDGATAVAQAVRTLAGELGQDADKALLKIDFENAFNRISRQVFLEEVARELPGLARWAYWCYARPSHLWAGGERLESSAGVRQGDPLGPLLFSLVLRRVTLRLQASHSDLDLHAWYLDDGTVVGSRRTVAAVLEYLGSPEVEAMGLKLKLSKCEVWWPSGSHGFPELPPAVVRLPCDGVDILKIPVGTDPYVAERLAAVLADVRTVLERPHLLEDAQSEFTLLRSCLGACKVIYRLRGTAVFQQARAVLAQYDGALREQFERILGDSLSDSQWSQAGFRPSEGGCGLRHTADVADAAFLGATLSACGLTAKLLGRDSVSVPGASDVAASFSASLDDGARRLVEDATNALQRGDLTPGDREACASRPQSFLQFAVDRSKWRQLESAGAQQGSASRLDAIQRKHAGAVWGLFPCQALGTKLASMEFRIVAKMWLGVAVYSDGSDGTRALLESSAGRITRHDAIRDVLFEACRAATLRPRRERTVDATGHRPGDIFLPNWSQGQPLAADVTVSHPSQATARSSAEGEETSASRRAALKAAEDKVTKHGARCVAAGVQFLPLAVCTYGGWLPEGEKFVGSIAGRIADHTGQSLGVVTSQLWQRLSVALWRTNAQIILHRAPRADCEAWDLPHYARASADS